ncbi:YggT family protein [Crassaminicella thermophila]|uniref:YggT family protein n=1 Tax=Crassaminicella thermophila TaxID=2599308 RepID=A0A5C0SCY8_CRATE|nr:YggT family protein [Crassaminicella thermophila]QEK11980.1 YggT family protein [Crassaminicella thermophila]
MWMIRQSVDYFFRVLDFLIIARILLSWINPNPNATIPRLIYQLTEPILAPFRNLFFRFGFGGGMIDFSPILAVFFLDIVRKLVAGLL